MAAERSGGCRPFPVEPRRSEAGTVGRPGQPRSSLRRVSGAAPAVSCCVGEQRVRPPSGRLSCHRSEFPSGAPCQARWWPGASARSGASRRTPPSCARTTRLRPGTTLQASAWRRNRRSPGARGRSRLAGSAQKNCGAAADRFSRSRPPSGSPSSTSSGVPSGPAASPSRTSTPGRSR